MAKAKKYLYHIIITSNGKQIKDIYHSAKESSVYNKFNKLIKENTEKIVFPVHYINNKGLKEANYEIFIIKSKEKRDSSETKIRDEYGRYISYVSSSDDWIILDRAHYNREETFWVYGFHPQLQRKDFRWIYNNYIAKNCTKYAFKNVIVFKNKLIIDVNGSLHMVLCKNKDDCVRLFNQLEEFAKKDKLKYIIWGGDASNSPYKSELYKRLMDWTGWTKAKLSRPSLRP